MGAGRRNEPFMSPRKSLFVKLGVILAPFAVSAALYPLLDPFRVICGYDRWPPESHDVALNRDFVSTEKFLHEGKPMGYDSFVLGSSRSEALLCSDWKAYLPDSKPYHFDASSESLFGIHGKVRLLDELGSPVKHALLVIDNDVVQFTRDQDGHLFIKHPRVSRGSRLKFQAEFFKAYMSDGFWLTYLPKAAGIDRPSGPLRENDPRAFEVDPVTNDVRFTDLDRRLAADPDAFYRERSEKFRDRETENRIKGSTPIGDESRAMLREIRDILQRRGADVHVIINPHYDQAPFNPQNLEYLQELFGKDRVFDFSGVNEFTAEMRNFYDPSHYRPVVGREILRRVYGR